VVNIGQRWLSERETISINSNCDVFRRTSMPSRHHLSSSENRYPRHPSDSDLSVYTSFENRVQVRAPPPPAVSPRVEGELRALRRKLSRLERKLAAHRVTHVTISPTAPAIVAAPAAAYPAAPYTYPYAAYAPPAVVPAAASWPAPAAVLPSPAATWAAPTAGRYATAGVGSSSVLAAVPTRPKVPPPRRRRAAAVRVLRLRITRDSREIAAR
jgi:hypothetical protein